jgi:hypothetical protein
VRQASLAPQLKAESAEPAEARGTVPAADDRDAEAVRAKMASLQRGWQRGRRDNGEDPRETGTPPRGEDPAADTTGPDRTGPDARDTVDHDGDVTGSTAPPGTTSGGDGP